MRNHTDRIERQSSENGVIQAIKMRSWRHLFVARIGPSASPAAVSIEVRHGYDSDSLRFD
jgi:hypothetical protein